MTKTLIREGIEANAAPSAPVGRVLAGEASASAELSELYRRLVPAPAESAPEAQRSLRELVAWGCEKAREHSQDAHRYLLVLRFALLNLVGFALLGAAYAQGLVQDVIDADGTYLSVLIFLVFVGGLAICARKVWQTSRELNSLRQRDAAVASPAMRHLAPLMGRNAESRSNLVGALRLRLFHRIAIVRNIANTLVLLGLIGTVLGFIIALSGVDPQRVADIEAIAPMVSTLIRGMSTALYTTLVGAILNVWLMADHQLLASGTVKLIAALVERAEDHARD
jgi:biopolymer transport protein ExbB/TolQ